MIDFKKKLKCFVCNKKLNQPNQPWGIEYNLWSGQSKLSYCKCSASWIAEKNNQNNCTVTAHINTSKKFYINIFADESKNYMSLSFYERSHAKKIIFIESEIYFPDWMTNQSLLLNKIETLIIFS